MPARDLVTVASDTSHPGASGGVVWKANFATLRDQLFLTSLVLQGIGFLFLLWTTTTVLVPAWYQNRSRFWHLSLVGTVLLLPVPLFEMAYALARLTGETIWPFPSYLSITSDVLLRTGYSIILLCRFFRLKLVSAWPRSRTRLVYLAASAAIVVVMTANLISTSVVRAEEAGYVWGTKIPASLVAVRARDRVIGLVTLSIAAIASIITDMLFYMVVVRSVAEARLGEAHLPWVAKLKIAVPYVAPVLLTGLYISCHVLSVVAPTISAMSFSAFSLSKLTPVVDTIVFFQFSISQTRNLLESLSAGSRNYGSHMFTSSAKANATASAAGSRSQPVWSKPTPPSVNYGSQYASHPGGAANSVYLAPAATGGGAPAPPSAKLAGVELEPLETRYQIFDSYSRLGTPSPPPPPPVPIPNAHYVAPPEVYMMSQPPAFDSNVVIGSPPPACATYGLSNQMAGSESPAWGPQPASSISSEQPPPRRGPSLNHPMIRYDTE